MRLKWKHALDAYQFLWMVNSHYQQVLAWEDAEQARQARARAEAAAAAASQAMMDAHPAGSLGHAKLNDEEVLLRSGLL